MGIYIKIIVMNKKIIGIIASITLLAGGTFALKDEIKCINTDVQFEIGDYKWCGTDIEYINLMDELILRVETGQVDEKKLNALLQHEDFVIKLKYFYINKLEKKWDIKNVKLFMYLLEDDVFANNVLKKLKEDYTSNPNAHGVYMLYSEIYKNNIKDILKENYTDGKINISYANLAGVYWKIESFDINGKINFEKIKKSTGGYGFMNGKDGKEYIIMDDNIINKSLEGYLK